MLESIGWIAAHRFLFSQLRAHLLGWPACLAPAGRRITLAAAGPTLLRVPTEHLHGARSPLPVIVRGTEIFPWMPKPKNSLCSATALIASLVIERLPRGELTRRAQEIAARHYDIPDSKRTAVSVDTLLDWAGRYRNGGFEALAPKPRQDRGQSRAVTPQLASLIERLKRENPHRTGTTLLRELALSCRPRRARHLAFHAVSLPQTTRPLGAATARTPGAQEV